MTQSKEERREKQREASRRWKKEHKAEVNAYNKKWRQENPEKWKAYMRKAHLINREKRKQKNYEAYLNYREREGVRERYAEHSRNYKQKHPEIVKAHHMASRIEMGKNCELCGSKDNLQRHHFDYSEPLIFVTICRDCHKFIHRKIK